MSQSFHNNRVQSPRFGWRSACGALLIGGLVGCSGTALQTESVVAAAEPPPSQAPAPDPTPAIDQSPIAAPPVTTDSGRQNIEAAKHPTGHPEEEADMTVLVLDNPELLAKSAYLDSHPLMAVDVADESPRKPHRMRFHYGFDKHRLDEADEAILREHAAYLRAHPEVTVDIHGHTDNFGPAEYNTFLSRLRASAAAKLLKEEGVRESQIQVSGWGSSRPLARPEDHAANRRLELAYHNEQLAKAQ